MTAHNAALALMEGGKLEDLEEAICTQELFEVEGVVDDPGLLKAIGQAMVAGREVTGADSEEYIVDGKFYPVWNFLCVYDNDAQELWNQVGPKALESYLNSLQGDMAETARNLIVALVAMRISSVGLWDDELALFEELGFMGEAEEEPKTDADEGSGDAAEDEAP